MSDEKYDPFDSTVWTYKNVDGYPVKLTMLIPSTLIGAGSKTPRPVILRWHGGFLFAGDRLTFPSCPQWALDLAVQKEAIFVTADYRLLPEATGKDVLDDIHDLIRWIGDALPDALDSKRISVDLSKMLVVGESAGGWCASQTFLTGQNIHPNVKFSAAILEYAVTDTHDRFFNERFEKNIMGLPQFSDAVLDDHIAKVKAGELPSVATEGNFEARGPLALSVVQSGRYLEFLGKDSVLNPIASVASYKGDWPRVLLLHSTEDTAVPLHQSENFAEELSKHAGADKVRFITQPGEHGFDENMKLDDPWLQPNVEWVIQNWQ